MANPSSLRVRIPQGLPGRHQLELFSSLEEGIDKGGGVF